MMIEIRRRTNIHISPSNMKEFKENVIDNKYFRRGKPFRTDSRIFIIIRNGESWHFRNGSGSYRIVECQFRFAAAIGDTLLLGLEFKWNRGYLIPQSVQLLPLLPPLLLLPLLSYHYGIASVEVVVVTEPWTKTRMAKTSLYINL